MEITAFGCFNWSVQCFTFVFPHGKTTIIHYNHMAVILLVEECVELLSLCVNSLCFDF